GEGVPNADFLGCYLRDDSFDRIRKDLDEGYRLGVNSTPTFFVDGTQVNWIEDKLMEDFLRSKFPRLKSISYQQKPSALSCPLSAPARADGVVRRLSRRRRRQGRGHIRPERHGRFGAGAARHRDRDQ